MRLEPSAPQQLWVVTPIFNEQDNLPELEVRLRSVLDTISDLQWSILFVNDGSTDQSLQILQALHQRDKRFKVLDLSRNFGHQAALSAGLRFANADAVVVMDGDLQDPPELIPELVQRWNAGANVVRAVRRSREESGVRRLGFDLFHKFFSWISDMPIESDSGVFCLMDHRALEQFNRLTETNRFIPGLRTWLGFCQESIYYDRRERAAGEPKQTLRSLFKYALDGIFSFSYKPLRLITCTGIAISVIGLSLAVWFIAKRLLGVETAQTGFTTLVTLITCFGGFQLVAFGVVGEYIARIYDEVKGRPLYLVKAGYGLSVAEQELETAPQLACVND